MATKSERTREVLVDTALRLFREQGYEATTMRAIAKEAGVSLGNAYYYFEGKDALVLELYEQLQEDHRRRCAPLLKPKASLVTNVRAVLHAGIDTMAPYHQFGSTLLHVALRRTSSVSPFSAESTPAREAALSLMHDVVAQSRGTGSGLVQERLPHALWLAYLGVTLFWVTDTSPQQSRTRLLVDGIAPIIARAVRLSSVPIGRHLAVEIFALIDRLAPTRRSTS